MAIDERKEALLADYLDGTLDEKDFAEVERLLKEDAKLAAEMKEAGKLVQMLSSLPDLEPPADLMTNVITATTEKSPFFSKIKEIFTFKRRAPFAAIAAGAIACITLVVVLTIPGIDMQKGKVAPGTFELDDMSRPAPPSLAKPALISDTGGKKEKKAEFKGETTTIESPVISKSEDKRKLKPLKKDMTDALLSKTETTGDGLLLSKNIEGQTKIFGSLNGKNAVAQPEPKSVSEAMRVNKEVEKKAEKTKDLDKVETKRNEIQSLIADESVKLKSPAAAKRSKKAAGHIDDNYRKSRAPSGGITMTPVSAGGRGKGGAKLDEGPMLGATVHQSAALEEAEDGRQQNLVIRNRFEGTNSGIGKFKTVLIINESVFSVFWKQLVSNVIPPKPTPKVDFSQSIVLGIFLGNKPTGGYKVKITSVKFEGGKLIVSAHVTQPSPKRSHTNNITRPFSMVIVGRPGAQKAGQSIPVEFIYE